jgi:hypothetical protein
MSIRQFSSRLELGFWQIVINLLSDSSIIQNLVRYGYLQVLPSTREFFKKFERQLVFRWAAAGLGIGFVIGILSFVF